MAATVLPILGEFFLFEIDNVILYKRSCGRLHNGSLQNKERYLKIVKFRTFHLRQLTDMWNANARIDSY